MPLKHKERYVLYDIVGRITVHNGLSWILVGRLVQEDHDED